MQTSTELQAVALAQTNAILPCELGASEFA